MIAATYFPSVFHYDFLNLSLQLQITNTPDTPMSNTPTLRKTRSGSNSSAITLNDIRDLIEKSRTEILNTVAQQNAKFQALCDSFLNRLEDLEQKNSQLEAKCVSLISSQEKEIKSLRNDIQIITNELSSRDDELPLNELASEIALRHEKRKNLVLAGIPEVRNGDHKERCDEDRQTTISILSYLNCQASEIIDVSRIGKFSEYRPRLIRIKCKTRDSRTNILKCSKQLRQSANYKNVFINPDLSKIQRDHDKRLREELKVRRNRGEDVKIERGKVVLSNSKQSVNSSVF